MRITLYLLCMFLGQSFYAQTIANSYSSAEIDSISNGSHGKEGNVYHDSQDNFFYIGLSNGKLIQFTSTPSSVVLNRNGGPLPNSTNVYYNFPVNSTHLQSIDSSTFNVIGNGEIEVLKAGTYSVTAGLSCNNMPAGGTKYIIGLFINNNLSGFISRGYVTLPVSEFWGTSGVVIHDVNANDVISVKYVMNAGVQLNAIFINVGVNKL